MKPEAIKPVGCIVPPRCPAPDQHQILAAFCNLYDAYYFHDNKTDAQFDAMDAAIKILQRFPEDNPRKKE